MAERVDVCIVGSGFGGSISAFRLAELYHAAGEQPSVMVLERGPRHLHTDFRQSMDVELLARLYGLVQGEGAQIVACGRPRSRDRCLTRITRAPGRHSASSVPPGTRWRSPVACGRRRSIA